MKNTNSVITKKEKPICPYCKSEDVCLDAFAEWDYEKQEWVLHSTYDTGFCQTCEQTCKSFDWITEETNDPDSNRSPNPTGETVQQKSTDPKDQS